MACQSIRWFAIALIFVVTAFASSIAQPREGKSARRDRYDAIVAEFDKQLAAFRKAASEAKTDADRDTAEKLRPSLNAFGKRLLPLAEEKPADDVSCDALVWIASNYGRRERMELDAALDLLEKHHLKSPKLKNVVDSLAYADSRRANALAETIADKAEDRTVRGMACLFLGYAAYSRTGAQDAKSVAEIEGWMKRLQKDYADVVWESRKLGELAEAQMFEIRNLIPGKVAPEIEGASVDGAKVKLSDHRGKVVVLVFWGSWCGPCMAEIPHLREMMTKYSRRPFTVVGVNCGDTKDRAAKVMQQEKMTWPVLYDGDDGPVARKWNVTAFPMIYILDDAGVIRSKGGLGDEEPEAVIERFVKKAEQKR